MRINEASLDQENMSNKRILTIEFSIFENDNLNKIQKIIRNKSDVDIYHKDTRRALEIVKNNFKEFLEFYRNKYPEYVLNDNQDIEILKKGIRYEF